MVGGHDGLEWREMGEIWGGEMFKKGEEKES